MISLDHFILIESELRNHNKLDLNYSGPDAIDCDFESLLKYPFNFDNDNRLRIKDVHYAWREIYHLIKELERYAKEQSYMSIAIKLNQPRAWTAT